MLRVSSALASDRNELVLGACVRSYAFPSSFVPSSLPKFTHRARVLFARTELESEEKR